VTISWEVAVPAGAELGERPVWDQADDCLVWVDILRGRVHRHRPGLGDHVIAELAGPPGPIPVGAAAPRRGGGYVLAAADGFRLMSPDGRLEAGVRPAGMAPDARFNDGACDPAGRFWAGTVTTGLRPGAGALYRLTPDGAITAMLEGVTESNGLCWSPDGRTFYYIDSGEHPPRVRAFAFDPASGELGRSQDLITFPPGDVVPDGMAVDAEGCLWIAMWGGGEVRRYAPTGKLLTLLPVPVSRPTCPGFGGTAMRHLYLTTAWEGMTRQERAAEPLAGHLLRTLPGPPGHPLAAFGG
jgi:sugar lactone lactonase YvrE